MPDASYKIISFRGGEAGLEQYFPFIIATWLRALKHGNQFFNMIDNKAFFTFYSSVIRSILANQNAVIQLAVIDGSEDTILGWSCSQSNVLHFIYVKPDIRRRGIGQALFPTSIDTITHFTNIGRSIWKNKLGHLKFNPF